MMRSLFLLTCTLVGAFGFLVPPPVPHISFVRLRALPEDTPIDLSRRRSIDLHVPTNTEVSTETREGVTSLYDEESEQVGGEEYGGKCIDHLGQHLPPMMSSSMEVGLLVNLSITVL